ncbi:MAG: UDP-N-acetylmuramyl pentapeptide phosphotransferase [Deltaproteobacteria bacterium]|nr:UDP-N-acetylmuramyl pentapeptide phosphotransferase [Deltaproteobacteria bacterium]
MKSNTQLLILYTLSFIISAGGAFFIAKFGHKFSLIDIPNQRSSHTFAMPKGGGVGILISFIYASFILAVPKSLLISGVILSVVSISDDIKDISVKIRLSIQLICSIIFLLGIFFYREVPKEIYPLFLILPVFIIGTINFYNFMDGIDGIAGIAGIIAFGLLAYYGYINGKSLSLIYLNISLSLSCAGFLIFNFPSAKVFMGDVGSVLLGFLFGAMALLFASCFLDILCILSFLFTFYADELTTMAVRLKNKESISQAHRKHLFQLFANELKVSHWKISLYYGIIQLSIGISAIFFRKKGEIFIFILLLLYFLIFSAVSYYVRKKVKKIS